MAAKGKAPSFSEVYHAIREALEKNENGYRFNDLAKAAGVRREDLQRHWKSLVSCNMMSCDRQTGRWRR